MDSQRTPCFRECKGKGVNMTESQCKAAWKIKPWLSSTEDSSSQDKTTK